MKIRFSNVNKTWVKNHETKTLFLSPSDGWDRSEKWLLVKRRYSHLFPLNDDGKAFIPLLGNVDRSEKSGKEDLVNYIREKEINFVNQLSTKKAQFCPSYICDSCREVWTVGHYVSEDTYGQECHLSECTTCRKDRKYKEIEEKIHSRIMCDDCG